MAKPLRKFMTVLELAKKVGVSPQAVRKAIKERRLYGYKAVFIGRQWLIEKV